MSKFFQALKQAEQDRALREQVSPTPPTAPARPGAGRFPRPEPLRAPDSREEFHGPVEEHLVSLLAPASSEAEQYRFLRHMVEQLHRATELSVLAVAGPTVGDGKTTTAINLAGALSQAPDARVLVIDADLRQPSLAAYLGLDDPDQPGLVAAILDPAISLKDVVRRLAPFNLDVLPAGVPRGGISDILRSPRLDAFVQWARQQYACVVVDTPPLLPVFDSALLAKSVDGVLVVVSANRTPRKLLGEALNMLDASKVLGIVFNRDDRPLFGYYNAYYRQYFPDASQVASEA